jgi:hypothetical protein
MRYDLPALVRRGRALAWSSSAPGRLLIRARLARSTTHPPPWRHAGRKFPAPSRGRRRAVRFIRRLPVLSLRPSSTTPCAVATMRGWSGRPSWSRPSPIPLSHVGFFCPLVQEFSNINKKIGVPPASCKCNKNRGPNDLGRLLWSAQGTVLSIPKYFIVLIFLSTLTTCLI